MRKSSTLRKKAKRGFQGYPIATVCFYGPTDEVATKVAVGIVRSEGASADPLERWFSEHHDVRHDAELEAEVARFILSHEVKSVVMTDGIIVCPHEEVIDYPEGTSCQKCPYWAGRARFTKERVQ
jgi:hypothetical protein